MSDVLVEEGLELELLWVYFWKIVGLIKEVNLAWVFECVLIFEMRLGKGFVMLDVVQSCLANSTVHLHRI